MLSQDIDFGKKIITEELKKLNLSENIVNSLQEEAFIKLNKMLARWNMNKPFRTNCLTEVDRASIEKIARNVCLEIAGQYEISNELKISKEYICFKDGAFYIGNKSANKKMIDDKLLEVYNFSFGKFEFFEYDLRFCDCCFKSDMIELQNMQKDYSYLTFIRCKFLNPIYLPNYEKTINHIIEMKDCIFCENVVINKVFNENIHFNNSTFKKYADFHESEFNKTACFYGVTFEKTPNFSQVIFKGNLNLVNSNLNFDFNECEKIFDKELSIHEEKETDIQNLTPKLSNKAPYKIASDFRDSFRGFKNALIKDNNLLDASNYHKIELYFKEIELKHKKPKIFSKEWIDLWQLKLYRLTSNHHTDLLKAFNSLMILIGVFALFGFLIMCLFNAYYGFYKYNPHSMIEFYNAHIANFVLNNMPIMVIANTILSFFWLFIFLICQICDLIRKIVILLCYLATFSLLILSPKYLIPAIGIFTDKRILLDPLSINGGLYTIFFGFIVYSFIKTARRNSIIPA